MSENNFVKLGDVAHECRLTWSGGQTDIPIVGLEHLVPGEIELSSWDSNIEHTFSKKFLKGQVLLGRRRVYLKKAVVAPCDGICSGDITVIESTGGILPELLPFVIQNDRFFDYAMQGSAGSLSPRVKWEHLKNYEFSLPPLAEQKVLADKLWAAYRLKESYKKLLAATEEMVKSQFIEMFDGDKYHQMELDSIAEVWLKGQAFKKDNICEEGTNFCIHYGELFTKYGPIIYDVSSTTNDEIMKASKSGDILFPASDVTPDGLARCSAIMRDEVLLGGDIIVLRPKQGNNPEYLSWAINMQKEQLLKRVTGSVVRHMSAKGLKTVQIPIAPIDKQKQFIKIVKQADKSESVNFYKIAS
jgi:type I restriction enzyme S subunit